MDLLIGVLMLAIYVVVVFLIVKGESPIITQLLLAIVWAILARVPLMGEDGTCRSSAIPRLRMVNS